MAYDKIAKLNGSTRQFQLSPYVKRYTLRDHGFQETKSGNFQYIRSLSTTANSKQGVMLKIVVASDLQTLKMSTTTANGLKSINVYGNKNMVPMLENLEYILDGFIEQNILEEVK